MKIREGFVSNSSTTSFTCDACGNTLAFSDCCSYSDMGIKTFSCGHETCCSEFDFSSLTDEEKENIKEKIIKRISDSLSDKYCSFSLEDVEYFKGIPISDLETLIEEIHELDSYPEEICPVCSLESFNNTFTFKYLLAKTGLTIDQINNEITEKFASMKDMKNWIEEVIKNKE
jgi:hypothetical protein